MNRSPSRSIHKVAWAAAIAYWLALLVATHLPPNRLPETHVGDKLEHFAAYALLMGLVLFAIRRSSSRLSASHIALATLIVLIYGVIDEQTQPWFGRTCSLADWIADASGAVAVALMSLFRR